MPGISNSSTSWRLRSFVDKKTGRPNHQLYVRIDYTGDWIFFERAATDKAEPLEIRPIDRRVNDCGAYSGECSHTEDFVIELGGNILKERSSQGFAIKASGHSGASMVMEVAPNQITQQLVTIDSLRLGMEHEE